MELTEVLKPELMDLNMVASNKDEVLNQLVDILFKAKAISSKDEYLKAVYSREKEGLTGIGNFIAIPHGKSDYVLNTCVAFARLKSPVKWESLDDNPVKMVFLLAVQSKNKDVIHIKLLSKLATVLAHDSTLKLLEEAKNPQDVLDIFTNDDQS